VFNLGGLPNGHTDAVLESEWLCGRRHPVTGALLRAESLSLPPGSLVSVFAHIAHAVEPRDVAVAGSAPDDPRLGCLFCYRDGSPSHHAGPAPPPSPGREVPPQWCELAAAGRLPRTLTELLRGEGVSYCGPPDFGVNEPLVAFTGPEGTFYG
jgi:hypothetical protein